MEAVKHICSKDLPGYRRVVDEKGNGTCIVCRACERDRAIKAALDKACIPKRQGAAALSAARHGPQATAALRLIEEPETDYLVAGPTGVGKSWLASAWIRHLCERARPAVYMSLGAALIRDKAAAANGGKRVDWGAVMAAPFLALDEVLPETQWERDLTDAIIVERHDEMRPTMVVTNATLDTLRGCLSAPAYHRVASWRRLVLDTEGRR